MILVCEEDACLPAYQFSVNESFSVFWPISLSVWWKGLTSKLQLFLPIFLEIDKHSVCLLSCCDVLKRGKMCGWMWSIDKALSHLFKLGQVILILTCLSFQLSWWCGLSYICGHVLQGKIRFISLNFETEILDT